EVAPLPSSTTIATCSRAVTWTFSAKLLVEREVWLLVCPRRTVILRRNPWAPLAGSLRAGQARGLRSQARFAQGRPVGSARRLASRRAGPWAPLAGSLRAGQARGLRSQARFAQGRRRRIYPASRCDRRSGGSFASSG